MLRYYEELGSSPFFKGEKRRILLQARLSREKNHIKVPSALMDKKPVLFTLSHNEVSVAEGLAGL